MRATWATNNGPGPVTCTASCSVSTSDGFMQTVNCTATIQAGLFDAPMCGTGPVARGGAIQQCLAFRGF